MIDRLLPNRGGLYASLTHKCLGDPLARSPTAQEPKGRLAPVQKLTGSTRRPDVPTALDLFEHAQAVFAKKAFSSQQARILSAHYFLVVRATSFDRVARDAPGGNASSEVSAPAAGATRASPRSGFRPGSRSTPSSVQVVDPARATQYGIPSPLSLLTNAAVDA